MLHFIRSSSGQWSWHSSNRGIHFGEAILKNHSFLYVTALRRLPSKIRLQPNLNRVDRYQSFHHLLVSSQPFLKFLGPYTSSMEETAQQYKLLVKKSRAGMYPLNLGMVALLYSSITFCRPDLIPGSTLELPFMGTIHSITIPLASQPQWHTSLSSPFSASPRISVCRKLYPSHVWALDLDYS